MSRKTSSSFLVNLWNISELLIFHWSSYFWYQLYYSCHEHNSSGHIALCSISIITGSFGLTLVFETLTMKTWRLYKIFVHYINPRKFLSNKTLLLFVCCLTLVDLVFCITRFVFDPITISYEVVSCNNLEGVITYAAEYESKAYMAYLCW